MRARDRAMDFWYCACWASVPGVIPSARLIGASGSVFILSSSYGCDEGDEGDSDEYADDDARSDGDGWFGERVADTTAYQVATDASHQACPMGLVVRGGRNGNRPSPADTEPHRFGVAVVKARFHVSGPG